MLVGKNFIRYMKIVERQQCFTMGLFYFITTVIALLTWVQPLFCCRYDWMTILQCP